MKFTVSYKPSAEQELADVWLSVPNRQALADAANKIDAVLKSNPHAQGESRDGRTRMAFERPLAVQLLHSMHADTRRGHFRRLSCTSFSGGLHSMHAGTRRT